MFKLIPFRNLIIGFTGRTSAFINPTNRMGVRWRSYKAAILEEIDKPLVITQITNNNVTDAGNVRVKVKYCSLNLVDVLRMSDKNSENYLPQIPGCEFAGEIIDVGNYTVKDFHPGDKCVALLDYDHQIGGGLAVESIVSESDCFPISVSEKIAALAIKSHGTAMLAFTKFCELNENDIVIVIAGSAGNGLAAVQIAKNVFKAKVYVICDTEDSSTVIRDEGAHKVVSVNEGLDKVYRFLSKGLEGKKAKCVYDAVGQGLMFVAADFVDPEIGQFLSVDPLYNPETFPSTKPEFKKPKKKSDESVADDIDVSFIEKIRHVNLSQCKESNKVLYQEIIEDTLSLCEEEIITPYVSKVFGLSEVNRAVEFIKSKTCTGKVLIDIEKADEKEDEEKKDKKKKDDD